ncbi:DNA-dependent RNA polymerase I subunit A43 [Pochonia chlamydosporia 170]|uniref:DNA-directed RNA polymerase subunit n=1 Tax=Pochonia chlamydosporia 170 TaxID=1380566 RepID=A0A179F7Z8_METCM|nr:DNA-dependent RNA polymerase I subunit A43 [Pochonia chlamydosporia 170]OAQ61460.1 DNA-dependent RNA polymerase I subunit A43 [Pochonia chlamydosporia 170]
MPAAASPEPATPKHEKKHKKDKSSKLEKKRAREEDAALADGERKHKRSKSVTADAIAQSQELSGSQDVTSEKKKKKKDKKVKHEGDAGGDDVAAADAAKSDKKKKKKSKHHTEETEGLEGKDGETNSNIEESKSEKKDKKKKKKHAEVTDEVVDAVIAKKSKTNSQLTTLDDPDAMDIDEPSTSTSKSSTAYQPPDIPADPQFPFFKQTVSLYEPLYPNGWAQPVTSCQYQHLQHLQNKYVPSLRGVLLDYKNVALGPEPGRDGAATDDETPTTVVSKEYAVGFGWITADVELFVPSRGAWMEGSVNLQTEGHIGVVCFGKFNASIEARRLPPAWKWVSNESPEAHGFEETASVITADDHGVVRQIHSTGFWVDGNGDRVKGKVRFRIRNFDAGTSGDTSYLSLEGTMLDKDSEKKLVKEEARTAQMRRQKKGGHKIERRRAPDFSMTRFEDVEAAGEGDGQQLQQGSEAMQES